jgi:hypothetical protein
MFRAMTGAMISAVTILMTGAIMFTSAAHAQIIDFESGGLKYKALTHHGVTIMFAPLPTHVRDYVILQVSIANGSQIPWAIRPEDFKFERADRETIPASSAEMVIHTLIEKAGRADAIKLIAAYEAGLYGIPQVHSTNGYEARRQNALGDAGSNKIKAAAAASAIALVTTKLMPGQSTDGAVFYANQGKPLGAGKLIVNTAGEIFEFPVEEAHGGK